MWQWQWELFFLIQDAEGKLVLLYLSVSSSCRPLRLWLPLTAQRAKVKEKLVRIQTGSRSNFFLNILLQSSYQSVVILLLLFASFTVPARGCCFFFPSRCRWWCKQLNMTEHIVLDLEELVLLHFFYFYVSCSFLSFHFLMTLNSGGQVTQKQ